jgi:hypothetical protein
VLRAGGVVRRCRQGLSVGVGLQLLFGSSPAAAAGVAGLGVSGLTTGLGLMTALWAVIGARRAPAGAAGMAALVVAVALVCSAFWIWRRQQARALFAARRRAPGAIVPRCVGFAIPAGLDSQQVLDAARGLPAPAGGLGCGRRPGTASLVTPRCRGRRMCSPRGVAHQPHRRISPMPSCSASKAGAPTRRIEFSA